MLSGGKDSLYAAYRLWPVDMGVILVYEFPRPSPHLMNLGKSVETLLKAGIPVVVARLSKGREREETVRLMRSLGVDEVVAGDVYVEDHLKYMESVARDSGATLREPLWGLDPEDLAHRIFDEGFETLIIGGVKGLRRWVGREGNSLNAEEFINDVKELGLDPLGERGEYHTLVVNSPLHRSKLTYDVLGVRELEDYLLARVV